MRERRMERETGIEPATNSLEGCDSTTELLPPSRLITLRPSSYPNVADQTSRAFPTPASTRDGCRPLTTWVEKHTPLPTTSRTPNSIRTWARKEVGGEGRVRTSVATWAADLQSAAIDRSATSPKSVRSNQSRAQPPTAPRCVQRYERVFVCGDALPSGRTGATDRSTDGAGGGI
jgi:hypothetical protein